MNLLGLPSEMVKNIYFLHFQGPARRRWLALRVMFMLIMSTTTSCLSLKKGTIMHIILLTVICVLI